MGIFFDSSTTDILVALVFLFFLLYRYSTSKYDFWESLGVPYLKPIPFFGNSLQSVLSLKANSLLQIERYTYFGDHRFGGSYTFRTPILFIKDPKLVEHILIKDFTTFYNRGIKVDTELDPLEKHLVNLEDAKWKNLRNKLTPSFTSGKLKGMHDQLLENSGRVANYLDKFEQTGEPFNAKNEMAKYTVDVIASCAFGLTVNILENPESEFRKMGERIFEASFLKRLRYAIRSSFPGLLRLFRWKSLPKELEDFFTSVVKETVEYRQTNNIHRNDFLQLLMELRKQDMEKPNRDDDLIFDDQVMTASAFVFFLAGYDTTASALSYFMYELGRNPEIQEKIYNEIQDKTVKHGGETTYNAVNEMTYMDQAISETLRRYPPATGTMRVARAPYKIPDTDIVLPKGMPVFIPIYALQHDPKYFPNPEVFDPDRFAEGKEVTKGTYLPFGDGPRICIGLRFAKLEIKYAIIKILQRFKISVNSKTQEPLQFSSKSILLAVEGGLWLNLEKRK